MIDHDSSNFLGGAKTFRHFSYLQVKVAITIHYRAKLIFRPFGVDYPEFSNIFGGPDNYSFFAETKIRYGISESCQANTVAARGSFKSPILETVGNLLCCETDPSPSSSGAWSSGQQDTKKH